MLFEKGKKRPENAGRKKGTPNRFTTTLKEAALSALNSGEGAQAFFENLKEKEPVAFSNFLAKILPSEISVQAEVEKSVVIEVVEFGRLKDG